MVYLPKQLKHDLEDYAEKYNRPMPQLIAALCSDYMYGTNEEAEIKALKDKETQEQEEYRQRITKKLNKLEDLFDLQ